MITPFQFGQLLGKQANAPVANPLRSDAHGSAYIPLVGGAISGAAKPHPGRSRVSNVLSEGAAGLGGGIRGALNGGVLGGLAGLPFTLATGRLGPVLGGAGVGAGVGSSLGTYLGAQSSRENIPLNARALEALKQPQAAPTAPVAKAAAQKQAVIGATLGALAGAVSGRKGKRLSAIGRGAVRGFGTEVGAAGGALLGLPFMGIGAIPGAIGGGVLGNMAAHGLLGPYENDDEKFLRQLDLHKKVQERANAISGKKKKPDDE